MIVVHLVRHAVHSLVDCVLCGRSDAVSLAPEGRDQARGLAAYFAGRPIDRVQSSPRLRTRETAAPIAERLGIVLECAEAFDELDVGEWTGRSFASLAKDEAWSEWNTRRGSARPPQGESMAELQARVVRHIEELRSTGAETVIVTHAEPIRAAVLHYRNMQLDRFAELTIAPGSVSTLKLHDSFADTSEINRVVSP